MKASFSPLLLAASVATSSLSAQTLSDYQSMVSSQNPTAYFHLDGSLESAVEPSVTLEPGPGGGFITDLFRNPTNSYYFVNQTDFLRNLGVNLISGGGTSNTTSTASGSISFLFRTLDDINTGQRYLFSAGGATDVADAFSLFLENTNVNNGDPNSLKLRFGDSTTTILPAAEIAPKSWYFLAVTYQEARVPNKAQWYVARLGGPLVTGLTTNSAEAVAGQGATLYLGNHTNINAGFRNPGSGRIDEFAIWDRELTFTEISNQFATLPQPPPPGGTYQQVIESQFPTYYFKLDNSLVDAVGNSLVLSTNGDGGSFTSDSLGHASSAYSFSETNDSLFITNDLINGGGPGTDSAANGVGTISFQFRMLSDTNNSGQRYLFAQPGGATDSLLRNQLGLFLENDTASVNPNSLKLRVGGGTFGNNSSSNPSNNVPVAYPEELVPNAWHYFAMVYNEAVNSGEVTVYFGRAGGTLAVHNYDPGNTDVVGNNGPIAIGNRVDFSSAFRGPGDGAIDEFAIWHDELSPAEIQAQFAAMAPQPPTLAIALEGNNVVLSWPSSGTAGYLLKSTSNLSAPAWSDAGTPTLVGDSNYVTNSATGTGMFYRLEK